jgi:glycosyl transferase family 25
MSIPIRIITLNPESDPVRELRDELKKQGFDSETSLGVDGRNGTPALIDDEVIDQEESLKMRMVELRNAEIGCYLSHYRLVKKAFEQQYERICILEDDVLIESSFADVLQAIDDLPSTFEFVRLMGLKRHRRKTLQALTPEHHLIRPHKGICGTQGYVINRIGMQKVIAAGKRIAEPIYKFYDHFWDYGLECFGVEPHTIWERSNTQSTIEKESRTQATKALDKRIRKNLIKLIRSGRRRIYISKRLSQFYPASKQAGRIGNTERIR